MSQLRCGKGGIMNNSSSKGFLYSQVSIYSIRVLVPILFVFGVCGNVLSFIILKKAQQTSTNFYLMFVAMSDTFVVIILSSVLFLASIANINLVSTFNCLILEGIFIYTAYLSSWSLVAVTTDRFIAVYFPLKAKIYCTRKRSKMICFLFLVFFFFSTSIVLFGLEKSSKTRRIGSTVLNCRGRTIILDFIYTRISKVFDIIMYSALPATLLLFFNTGIILKVTCENKVGPTAHTMAKTSKKTTKLLLTVTTAFIICSMPQTIISIIASYGKDTYDDDHNLLQLLFDLSSLLVILNHSINFVMYMLTASYFKKSFLRTFCLTFNKNFQRNDTSKGCMR